MWLVIWSCLTLSPCHLFSVYTLSLLGFLGFQMILYHFACCSTRTLQSYPFLSPLSHFRALLSYTLLSDMMPILNCCYSSLSQLPFALAGWLGQSIVLCAKGCALNPQSEHIPRPWVWSPVRPHIEGSWLLVGVSLSHQRLSLSLCPLLWNQQTYTQVKIFFKSVTF